MRTIRSLAAALLALAAFSLPGSLALAQNVIQQSDTAHPITFLLTKSDYHVNGLTGGIITATISKNAASFASPGGSFAEVGNGIYAFTPSSGDVGTFGALDLHAQAFLANATTAPTPSTATTGGTIGASTYTVGYTWITAAGETAVSSTATQVTTGSTSTITVTTPALPTNCSGINVYEGASAGSMIYAGTSITNSLTFTALPSGTQAAPGSNTAATSDPVDVHYCVVAYNPYDAVRMGLTALPNASPAASGGLPTVGTGAGQINPDGGGSVPVNATSVAAGVWNATQSSYTTGGTTGASLNTSATNATTAANNTGSSTLATAILGATASSYNSAGTIGAKINAGGNYVDPWGVSLPGSYTTPMAGYLIGHFLDAQVSTRSTYAGGDTSGTTTLLSRVGQSILYDGSGYVKANVQVYASGQDPATYDTAAMNTAQPGFATANSLFAHMASADTQATTAATQSTTAATQATTAASNTGASTIANDVLGATAASYNSAGTIGAKINAAGSAGDPWATTEPGAYGSGTFGYYLTHTLSTYAGGDTSGTTTLLSRLGQSILFDGSGFVKANAQAYAAGAPSWYAAPSTLAQIWGYTQDGSLSAQDILTGLWAQAFGVSSNSWSSGSHTLTTIYKRQDTTTTAVTNATVYASGSSAPPVQTRSSTNGTLP